MCYLPVICDIQEMKKINQNKKEKKFIENGEGRLEGELVVSKENWKSG